MIRLGVNVDHVATVRQARRTNEPDPVAAAALAELGGADAITVHLREDRRHIQERDVRVLAQTLKVDLNLEMAMADDVIAVALEVGPAQVMLVPERREEVTTEGGLDLAKHRARCTEVYATLRRTGAELVAFVDADPRQVDLAVELGLDAVEINTGPYSHAKGAEAERLAQAIAAAGSRAVSAGLGFHAGHGLTVRNVRPIARLGGLTELNIGHSIVARAISIGMVAAVREMKDILVQVGGA